MKKKGFTLIELLAVIVILAIIALIATPLVLKYIETSRIESFKVSVENIKDSALKYVASEQLNGKVNYPVIVDVKDLDFKGKEDYTGKVRVLKNGVVEEFVEKDNYRSGNGGFINKKNEPHLIVKEGQSAVIDDKNGYVYSFYTAIEYNNEYRDEYLTEDILKNIFDVKNGTVEYVTNGKTVAPYSTGAKIVVKDNDGNVYKEYQIIIFGDIDGNGVMNNLDYVTAYRHFINDELLSGIKFISADVNRDMVINQIDINIFKGLMGGSFLYNQFTNQIEVRLEA